MSSPGIRFLDPREQPAYSIAEAAHYLGMPAATILYWSKGQGGCGALISVPDHTPTLLSFLNLTELHVLAAIRREYSVSMPKIRTAIHYLEEIAGSASDRQHPLISRALETDGLDLFIEQYGRLINISRSGQIAMREVISTALHRIERDPRGIPMRLYPFTRNTMKDTPEMIVIDPKLSGGRPVISGTGLSTTIIAERYKAGESIGDLTRDYERSEAEIEEAIRCELRQAA